MDEGNVAELLGDETVDVYVVTDPIIDLNNANFANSSDRTIEWILDSGCAFHITSKRTWLEDFKDLKVGEVIMGKNVPVVLRR